MMKSSQPVLLAVGVLLIPALSFAAKGGKNKNKQSHRHGNDPARMLNAYDRNHNQVIDSDELPRLQSAFSALKGLDKNADGTIDQAEAGSLKLTGGSRGGNAHAAIAKADANGNHKIDAEETEGLQKALSGSRMMKRFDTNGNGKVDTDELDGLNKRMAHSGKHHGHGKADIPSTEKKSAAEAEKTPAGTAAEQK